MGKDSILQNDKLTESQGKDIISVDLQTSIILDVDYTFGGTKEENQLLAQKMKCRILKNVCVLDSILKWFERIQITNL